MSESRIEQVADYLGFSPEERQQLEAQAKHRKTSVEALVSFRLSESLLAELSQWAAERSVGRSELIRELLGAAVSARGAETPVDPQRLLDDAIATLQSVRASYKLS